MITATTIAGSTRKTVAFKEDEANSKITVERVKISGDEMALTNVIQTGVKTFIQIPYNATITGVSAFADVSGSIVVDWYKQPYGTFSPTLATYTNGYINKAVDPFNSRWTKNKYGRGNFRAYRNNTISSNYNYTPFVNWALNPRTTYLTPITITSTVKYQDTTLTGHDTNVNAGDIICFVVNSVTTITRLDVNLSLTKK